VRKIDMEHVALNSDGSLRIVYSYWLSNYPVGQAYDETRTVLRILYARSGRARGDVFLGSNHGVDRVVGTDFLDHIHLRLFFPDGSYTTGWWQALALDGNDDLWTGGQYIQGLWPWTPNLWDWGDNINSYYWKFKAFPDDPNTRDDVTGIAITPDGKIWLASSTWGLGSFDPVYPDNGVQRWTSSGIPTQGLLDVVAPPDGTLWIGTDQGVYHWDPDGVQRTVRYTTADGLPSNRANGMFLDTDVSPPAIYVAMDNGLVVFRAR
jgi:hypothetical protein